MAIGKDVDGDVKYRLELQVVDEHGTWRTYSYADGNGSPGYTEYTFPSRPQKPNPLRNTSGVIIRQRINMSTITQSTSATSRMVGPAVYAARGKETISYLQDNGAGLSALALKRLNSRDLNLGVILVEGRETYGLLANAAKALAEAYTLLKKKDAKGALKTLGVSISGKQGKRIDRNTIENGAANSWLQIQFGWLPLLNDVYTAVGQSYNALEKGRLVRGKARRGSKRGSDIFDPRYVPSSNVSWSGTVSNPRLAWLQSFGLLNPLTLAWEATRMSYLVDWLFHVNTFLNAMTATAGLTNTRSSITIEYLSRTTVGSHVTRTYQKITRSSGASITMGNPLNFDMGGWHVATALAQAKQVFRNRR